MTTGAQRAEAQPENGTMGTAGQAWAELLETTEYMDGSTSNSWDLPDPEERPFRARVLGKLMIVLALAWTGASVWSIWQGSPALTLGNALQWVTFVSPPLILLGIAWLILGQTPRRETERFTRAVAAMRSESSALESILAIVATRLEENHTRLRGEATKLMSLGDEASDRLGRVAYYLSKESANLDKKSEALETAAEAARIDIGVLLHDLPRAEEQARAVADAMKEAGLTAHSQAGALEGQLSALLARGREADEVVGGAAQRLGAHLARVESTTATAAVRMDEAAASMTAAVDDSMARAAEAVDAARSGLEAQGAAMLAMIQQSRAALDRAGEDAGRNLAQRLELIGGKIEGLAGHLAAQDAASHALVTGLSKELAELDERFAALGESGSGNSARIDNSIQALRASTQALFDELSGGQDRAGALIDRAHEMAEALTGVTAQLNGDVPAALARVEEQSEKARDAATSIVPQVAAIEASATSAAAKLAEAEASIARQQESLDASGAALTSGLLQQLADVEQRFAALRESGGVSTGQLSTAILEIRESVSELAGSLDGGQERAADLTTRARDMGTALAAITEQLDQHMPAALARIEEQAARTGSTASSIAPDVAAIEASAGNAAAKLAEAESSIARQQEALDASGSALTTGLLRQLGEVEARFAAVNEAGGASTTQLSQAIADIRAAVGELAGSLEGGEARAADLTGRAREMAEALAAIADQLDDRVPASLTRIEEQAARTGSTASAIAPDVAAIEASAGNAAAKLAEAEASIARQQERLEASSSALTSGLLRQLGEVEERFAALSDAGGASTAQLSEAIAGIRASVTELATSLEGGEARAADLTGRTREMRDGLAGIAEQLDEHVPAALGRVEEQAERARTAASGIVPTVQALQTSSESTAATLAEAEASVARQQEALDALLARISAGVGGAEEQLRALGSAVGEADGAASRMVAETGPELIEALLRVREAATQAADRAREAISAVIPQSAFALAEASRQAVSGAISGTVEQQMGELGRVAEKAVETARKASERLTRQMLTIGETAAAVEARIEEGRKDRDGQDAENFSRRVALLIESLNSTAIDVTKILSNEVTDSAWAAYLKGDRGVFTRRAVRLLDNSEAREIVQHYEAEPEFREQVNRYIHDFESMLRRILADRDSSALGVTILSSDMGKLYVALAQAIERLR
ncbi:MAG TPA: hypothetical protein VK391_06510 [Allosphingosinicella sp.]|nr:hypothetical protein [Allosphingosinicella sp.]